MTIHIGIHQSIDRSLAWTLCLFFLHIGNVAGERAPDAGDLLVDSIADPVCQGTQPLATVFHLALQDRLP